MIFVTVGSMAFDELAKTVDEAVGQNKIHDEVVIQIGVGEYLPRHCPFFRSAPTLEPYYARADLVVGHGGTGTTLEVIQRGLPLVSVANWNLKDNHQHEFLEALEEGGFLSYCRDLGRLIDAIATVPRQPTSQGRFVPPWVALAGHLDEWNARARARSGLFQRLAAFSLRNARIAPNEPGGTCVGRVK